MDAAINSASAVLVATVACCFDLQLMHELPKKKAYAPTELLFSAFAKLASTYPVSTVPEVVGEPWNVRTTVEVPRR